MARARYFRETFPQGTGVAGVAVLACPSNYDRVWLGINPVAGSVSNLSISTQNFAAMAAVANLVPGATVCPQFKLTQDDTPLVWQEWWVAGQATGNICVVWEIWEQVTADKKPGKYDLLLPSNGRHVDPLDTYQPAEMETLLSQLRRATRRFSRA